jgi:hypothetical protein
MGTTATYQLTGDGVTLTYSTNGPTLDVELDDSFHQFKGTHQLSASDLTVVAPTEDSVGVSGVLKHVLVTRGGKRILTLGVELFVAAVQPDQAAKADSAGVAVLIPPSDPPEFRTAALTGTLSVVTTDGGR